MLRALLGAAGAAARRGVPAWPLPAGLGGITGDWVLRLPVSVAHLPQALAALALGIAALVCLAVVAGFGFHSHTADEDKDAESEKRAAIIGWITHGFLSLRA